MNALVVFGIYSGGVCASPDDQLISEPIAEVHFRIRVFTKTRDLLHDYNYYGGIAFFLSTRICKKLGTKMLWC